MAIIQLLQGSFLRCCSYEVLHLRCFKTSNNFSTPYSNYSYCKLAHLIITGIQDTGNQLQLLQGCWRVPDIVR